MMRFFWQKQGSIYDEDIGHMIRQFNPLNGQIRPETEFISVPNRDILPLVEKYIAAMETEESAEWCRCEWIIHPDDTEIDRGNCRECNMPKKAAVHQPDKLEWQSDRDHPFRGIRKRRGDQDPTCPVHTREGMVIYFFEWIFTDAART